MLKRAEIFKLSACILGILIILTSSVVFAQQNLSSPNISMEHNDGMEPISSAVQSYVTHSPIFVDTNSDFVSQGYPGNGSSVNPYVIAGYNITTTGVCIRIQDTDAYFVIRDCILSGGPDNRGIELDYVFNGLIRNNTVFGKLDGIQLDHSEYNIVLNNTFSDNSHAGVDLYKYSHTNVVANNTIFGKDGITCQSSYYNKVSNNTISGNSDVGVGFIACKENIIDHNIILNDHIGVFIYGSNNMTVANNTVTGGDTGVYVHSGDDNKIANNTILENDYGFSMGPTADNNTIYLNIIAYSTSENAIDDGRDNKWNSTTWGNYWSDYSGSGVYNIPGDGGYIDYHPFSYDTRAPTIDHPVDVEYVEGTTGHSITWNATDFHPSHYEIVDNGTEVITHDWNGDLITVTIDSFEVGIHNIEVNVHDTFGYTTTDLVIVTVLPEGSITYTTNSTTTTDSTTNTDSTTTTISDTPLFDTMTLLMLGGGIGAIVVVILIVKLRK
ncbi:MAG: NosD domain-containing protein [Candidatus Thorarchaeota archaeon]